MFYRRKKAIHKLLNIIFYYSSSISFTFATMSAWQYTDAQVNTNNRYGVVYNLSKSSSEDEARYDTENVALSPEVLAQIQPRNNANIISNTSLSVKQPQKNIQQTPSLPINPLNQTVQINQVNQVNQVNQPTQNAVDVNETLSKAKNNTINPQIANIIAQKQENFKSQQVEKIQKPFKNTEIVSKTVNQTVDQNNQLESKKIVVNQVNQLHHEPIPEFQAKSYPQLGLYAANNTTIAGDYLVLEPDHQQTKTLDLTIRPEDVWSRIRRGYAIPNIDNQLVKEKEEYYASKPDYLQRIADRSGKYIYYILEELEKRGMPTELALLPMIESAYNPSATSPVGAAGIWQFMPGTGRWFNLKQDGAQDERRNIIASTKAALDYLQYLYNFHGDWQLALASYNWGEGSVQKAVKRNRDAGLPTGYLDLSMPKETKEYIPKLQAVKNLINQPAKFGIDLPIIANSDYFNNVLIEGSRTFDEVAQLAEISINELKLLNPGIKGNIIQNKRILLPIKSVTTFEKNVTLNGQQAQQNNQIVSVVDTINNQKIDLKSNTFTNNINDNGLNSSLNTQKKTIDNNIQSQPSKIINQAETVVQIAPNWTVKKENTIISKNGETIEYKLPSIYATTTIAENEDVFDNLSPIKTSNKSVNKIIDKKINNNFNVKNKDLKETLLKAEQKSDKLDKNHEKTDEKKNKTEKKDRKLTKNLKDDEYPQKRKEPKNVKKNEDDEKDKDKDKDMKDNIKSNSRKNNKQDKETKNIEKKEIVEFSQAIKIIRIDPYERVKQNNKKGAEILKQQLKL